MSPVLIEPIDPSGGSFGQQGVGTFDITAGSVPVTIEGGDLDRASMYVTVSEDFSGAYAVQVQFEEEGDEWFTARDRDGTSLTGKSATEVFNLCGSALKLRMVATVIDGDVTGTLAKFVAAP